MNTKKNLLTLFTIFAVILLVALFSNSVNATTITITEQKLEDAMNGTSVDGITYSSSSGEFVLSNGDYVFDTDIDTETPVLFSLKDSTTTIDLNEKEINANIVAINSTLTIDGTKDAIFKNGVVAATKSVVTVNGGTYKGSLSAEGGKLIVNDAIVNAEGNDAIYVYDNGELIVNKGTFTSGYSAIMVESFGEANPKSVTINGGTFTGKTTGLWVGDLDSLTLNGGTFTATVGLSENNETLIVPAMIYSGEDTEVFSSALGDGYEFSSKVTPKCVTWYEIKLACIDLATASITTAEEESTGSSDENQNSNQQEQNQEENNKETNKEENNKEESKKEEDKDEFVIADDDDNEVDEETARLLAEIRKMLDDLLAGTNPIGIDEDTARGVAKARSEGKQIKVDLSAKEVAKEEVAEDVEKAEQKLAANEKIAGIFDVSINLKADNNQLGKVTKLNKKVAFKLPIPEELRTVPAGYERIFSLLNIHGGVTNRIDAESDGENVRGESDEYSTYVLTYTDKKITSNPTTGDAIAIYVAIFTVATAGAIVVFKKIK